MFCSSCGQWGPQLALVFPRGQNGRQFSGSGDVMKAFSGFSMKHPVDMLPLRDFAHTHIYSTNSKSTFPQKDSTPNLLS